MLVALVAESNHLLSRRTELRRLASKEVCGVCLPMQNIFERRLVGGDEGAYRVEYHQQHVD